MKKIIILAVFTCSLSAAVAQQQKGDFQVQAQASYISFSGIDIGSIYFNASKFVTDNVEVGASPYVTISSFAGDTNADLNLTVFGNYSFLTANAKMIPYLGAGITFYGLGGDTSQTGLTLKGGLRYFVTERVNIDIGPNLVFVEGANIFILNAGLGYIFGKRG